MKYLIMLLLPLTLILTVGCEKEDDDDACTDLATASADAALAYSDAVLADLMGDHSALCAANVAAYKAGLDGGCSGFDQAGLDEMEAACEG